MDLSIIIVSYNTRQITLECLASVYEQTEGIEFEVILVDNDSADGSAEAVAQHFPQTTLFALKENLGFAAGNNFAARHATGEYILLLNPDTVVLDSAVQNLLAFARSRPRAGIVGGRTLYGDHSLNPMSCWARPTLWSQFCIATGLTRIFKQNRIFDPETYGRWPRDTEREVDIVTGCLFLLSRTLWDELKGFDPIFFQRGEEADMCLRARALGYRPRITPTATIIHYGGLSETVEAEKVIRNYKARTWIIERHWPRPLVPLGKALHLAAAGHRLTASLLLSVFSFSSRPPSIWHEVWRNRRRWMQPGPITRS
ncbi:MAG: glycosyltransferase family 2 protein [Planctomycetota bacterium]|nr:glycosyltransferase family 2 protein [Planctomycetota bacterium]